jgi:2-phosphosulfolactate phosphatase
MFTDQTPFAVRFEWGERGLDAVVAGCKSIVIVDVCSFCTAVDVATSRGAAILPYAWRDGSAAQFAAERGATLAGESRTLGGYSLSPSSLTEIEPDTRLVLTSRNGATLSLQAAKSATTIAACLRNASAVAEYVRTRSGPVAVIAGGERWPDDTLRPAWEDLVGAGAVIAQLPGPRSPEAEAACAAFAQARADSFQGLARCASGRELIERGFARDVELAGAFDVSKAVPIFDRDAFTACR